VWATDEGREEWSLREDIGQESERGGCSEMEREKDVEIVKETRDPRATDNEAKCRALFPTP
jgi:hypothetical protein